jgi:IclR family pca regulon transcriptional regulator
VLLAHQPKEWQDAYLRKTRLVAHTPKTIVNKTELRELLRKIRETGLSRTHEDVHEGVSAFASPIFDRSGQTIAALTLAAPTSRANEGAKRFSTLVKLAAADISEAMGFNGATSHGTDAK